MAAGIVAVLLVIPYEVTSLLGSATGPFRIKITQYTVLIFIAIQLARIGIDDDVRWSYVVSGSIVVSIFLFSGFDLLYVCDQGGRSCHVLVDISAPELSIIPLPRFKLLSEFYPIVRFLLSNLVLFGLLTTDVYNRSGTYRTGV